MTYQLTQDGVDPETTESPRENDDMVSMLSTTTSESNPEPNVLVRGYITGRALLELEWVFISLGTSLSVMGCCMLS